VFARRLPVVILQNTGLLGPLLFVVCLFFFFFLNPAAIFEASAFVPME
jgi:hypothetical protein